MSHVDEVFCATGQVRYYRARFPGREEGICSESVRNEATSSTRFLPQRKEPEGRWRLAELEESLAETSKSRSLGERLEGYNRQMLVVAAISAHLDPKIKPRFHFRLH